MRERVGRNVWLALAAAFIGVFAFRLSVPVVAFYTRMVLEASAISMGALMAVFFAARTPASILAGKVYRGGLSVALASLCLGLAGVVTLLYALAGSVGFVLILRLLQGLLMGFAWTVVQIVLGASVPRRVRGTVYAVYFASGVVAFSAANAVYALMAQCQPIVVLGVSFIGFLACSLLVAGMEAPVLGGRGGGGGRGRAARIALGVIVAVSVFVFFTRLCTAFVVSDVTYVYLKEVYGLSRASVAELFAAASAIEIPVSIALSLFADRVSDRVAVLLIGLLTSAGLVAFASPNFLVSCCGLFLLVAGSWSLTPLSRKLALTYKQAEGIGYVSAVRSVGIMLSSLAAGVVYQLFEEGGVSLLTLTLPAAGTVLASSLLLVYMLGRSVDAVAVNQ